jgi:NAD(P)-dependent dehydrogenase (short-subunit alcohol dehydrogenase family)
VSLHDKVALVTGAGSGIGRGTAIALAEAGAVVVCADIDEASAQVTAQQVEGHAVRVDVSSLEDNRAMFAAATEAAGGVDLVFLNAGVSTGCSLFEDFDEEKYRRANGINLDGVIFGTHLAIEALRERGGGAIVATASLAGLTGVAMDPVYTANKHAVVGIARSMGPALAHLGIRYNAICPGFTESKIIEDIRDAIGQMGVSIIPTEEVANAVVHLFDSDLNGECWFVQPGRQGAFQFRHVPGPRA